MNELTSQLGAHYFRKFRIDRLSCFAYMHDLLKQTWSTARPGLENAIRQDNARQVMPFKLITSACHYRSSWCLRARTWLHENLCRSLQRCVNLHFQGRRISEGNEPWNQGPADVLARFSVIIALRWGVARAFGKKGDEGDERGLESRLH